MWGEAVSEALVVNENATWQRGEETHIPKASRSRVEGAEWAPSAGQGPRPSRWRDARVDEDHLLSNIVAAATQAEVDDDATEARSVEGAGEAVTAFSGGGGGR